jgi:hypothetical protein
MNMQTIQIMILMLDTFKLAPWQIVTDAIDRIGYGAGGCVARSFSIVLAVVGGLFALPLVPIVGPLSVSIYLPAAISPHTITVQPVLDSVISGFHFAVALLTGLWWYDKCNICS